MNKTDIPVDAGNIISRVDRLLLTDKHRCKPLDGVRALAITLVVLRHTLDAIERVPGGNFLSRVPRLEYTLMYFGDRGVHLFFVLSGFLIGGIIYRALRDNRFSLRKFYANRALRIFPISWLFIILTSWQFIEFDRVAFYNFAYITNYTKHYYDSLGHYWSLNVEEHFYLIFPFVFLLFIPWIRQSKTKYTLTALALFTLAAWTLRAYAIYFHPEYWPFHLYKTHYLVDFFFLGIIGAVICEHDMIPKNSFFSITSGLIIFGLPLLAILDIRDRSSLTSVNTDFYFFPLLGLWCLLLIILSRTQESWLTKFLSAAPFRWIAALSYSMYIFHNFGIDQIQPYIDNIAKQFSGTPHLMTLSIALSVYCTAVLLSVIAFLLVERPFLMIKQRYFSNSPTQK